MSWHEKKEHAEKMLKRAKKEGDKKTEAKFKEINKALDDCNPDKKEKAKK